MKPDEIRVDMFIYSHYIGIRLNTNEEIKMNHLYEDKRGVLHTCVFQNIHRGIDLVWTTCLKDVPANASFKTNYENPTCNECLETHCDICGDYHETGSVPISCESGDGM